jgi:hypothetical protein
MAMVGDWTLRVEVKIIYSLIYVIIFIVGIIGNGLLIGKIRHKLTVANVFLINLAVSDLVSQHFVLYTTILFSCYALLPFRLLPCWHS